MILTVEGYKGGIAKTTTAVHLAAYLQMLAPTLLVDGDANRSASLWALHGALPFTVVPEAQAMKHARQFEHIVIDTGAPARERAGVAGVRPQRAALGETGVVGLRQDRQRDRRCNSEGGMTDSKFSGFKAMRERRAQEVEETANQPATPTQEASEETRCRVGGPPDERSNPDYQQVTVLLHGQTYLETGKRLIDESEGVSELIDELLDAWLRG